MLASDHLTGSRAVIIPMSVVIVVVNLVVIAPRKLRYKIWMWFLVFQGNDECQSALSTYVEKCYINVLYYYYYFDFNAKDNKCHRPVWGWSEWSCREIRTSCLSALTRAEVGGWGDLEQTTTIKTMSSQRETCPTNSQVKSKTFQVEKINVPLILYTFYPMLNLNCALG